MRSRALSVALRLCLAAWLFTVVVALLYLIGMGQSFSEDTLSQLFRLLRWTSWGGLVGVLALLPWVVVSGGRFLAIVLGLAFLVLFLLVAAWGAWLYPQSGVWPW